jgi:hypothetical protein
MIVEISNIITELFVLKLSVRVSAKLLTESSDVR